MVIVTNVSTPTQVSRIQANVQLQSPFSTDSANIVGAATAIGVVGYKFSGFFDQFNIFAAPSRLLNTADGCLGVKDTIGTVSNRTKNVAVGIKDTVLDMGQDSTNMTRLQEHAGTMASVATNVASKPSEIGNSLINKLPSMNFMTRTEPSEKIEFVVTHHHDNTDGGNRDKSTENTSRSGASKLGSFFVW